MAIPSVVDAGAHAHAVRSARKWLRGWRFTVLASAAAVTAAVLAFAWTRMDDGHVFVLLVIAGLGVVACLSWVLFSDGGRHRTSAQTAEPSDWEARVRPHFPSDEEPEIDFKHQSKGDES